MSIIPLHDKVLAQRAVQDEVTDGGIVLPQSVKKEQDEATVIAVGDGDILPNGDVRPLAVRPGDVIIIDKFSGQEVTYNGEEFVIVREDDIVAIIRG